MKPHTWEIETIDGGHVGEADFWICRACGLSGGCTDTWFPVTKDGNWGMEHREVSAQAFFRGWGPGLLASEDCDKATRQYAKLKELGLEFPRLLYQIEAQGATANCAALQRLLDIV